MKWSIHQKAIFTMAVALANHLVIIARAGTGKTTVLVEIVKRLYATTTSKLRVCVCCFNVGIRAELQARMPRQNGLFVQSFGSIGNGSVRKAFPAIKFDEYKTWDLIRKVVDGQFDEQVEAVDEDGELIMIAVKVDAKDYRGRVRQLVSMSKSTLRTTKKQMAEKAMAMGLCQFESDPDRFANWATKVIEQGLADTTRVDYDDQWYMPVALDLFCWPFNVVLVDEAQDLTACQLELVNKCIGRNGKLMVVGDDMQAIYEWRGATPDMLDYITTKYNADVLSLPTTYRCPTQTVNLVHELVPDYQAGPDNPMGIVLHDTQIDYLLDHVQNGDMLIGRKNAGNLADAMMLAGYGHTVKLMGANIKGPILALIKQSKLKDDDCISRLLDYVATWLETQRKLCEETMPDAYANHVDTAEMFKLLCSASRTGLIGEIKTTIDRLFVDDKTDPADCITVSTIHKAKGLEFPNVWLDLDSFNDLTKASERRLFYVAATRNQEKLYIRGIDTQEILIDAGIIA